MGERRRIYVAVTYRGGGLPGSIRSPKIDDISRILEVGHAGLNTPNGCGLCDASDFVVTEAANSLVM